jgi:hypothetical protein
MSPHELPTIKDNQWNGYTQLPRVEGDWMGQKCGHLLEAVTELVAKRASEETSTSIELNTQASQTTTKLYQSF